MNNFTVATEATATAMDSAGSATKENEIYLQSIEGRMKSLEATMDGFWTTLIDSDLIRGGVDLLQLFANGLTGLQDAFGTTGLAVGTLMTAWGLMDSRFNVFAESIIKGEKSVDGYVAVLKNLYSTTIKTNGAIGTAKSSVELLKTGFSQLANSATVTKIKVLALQTALSFGLGLAVSAITSLIVNLGTSLFDTQGRMEDIGEASKTLGEALDSKKTFSSDIDSYKELKEKIEDVKTSEEERKKAQEEIEEVKKRLYELDDNAYGIINNQNMSYKDQYDWLKKINELKVKEQAVALEKEMSKSSGFFGNNAQVQAEAEAKKLEAYITNLKEIQRLQAENKGNSFSYGTFGNMNLDQQNEAISKLKENITQTITKLQGYNSNVQLIIDANGECSLSTVELSEEVETYLETLEKTTDALNDNTKAKEQNTDADRLSDEALAKAMETSSKQYAESLTALQSVYDLLEELNEETAMTPEIASKLLKMFPEIGTRIGDVAETQEFLNQKLKEQEEIANQAYETMVLNDTNYYRNKLLNDASWQESYRQSLIDMGMSQKEAYDLDLGQFQTLNQLKTYAMNTLAGGISEWLNQYIDTSANGYNIDFNNFKTYAEAKEAILKALNEQIKKVTKNLASAELMYNSINTISKQFGNAQFGALGEFNNTISDKLQSNINEYKNQLSGLHNAIEELDNKIGGIGVGNIQMGGVNFKNPISYSPSGGSSSSNKGNSNKEKEKSEYKATLEQWYTLKDAIEDVNNQIEQNQILRARAEGTAKEQEYIKKEVELLKKQIDLKKQLQKEMEKERNNLKSYLMSQGGVFNGENLTNYEKLLGWTATTDEGKEKLQQLEEAVKSYTDLCNSEIPNVKKEWEGLQDQIDELLGTYEKYKVDTEKWFALKDQINDVSVAIERYEYLRNKTTSDKREQEYIQKEIELLQQQITLKKRLQAEMEKEKNQLKALIEASGGKFKGNNLTNYEALFGQEAVGKEAVEKLKELEEAFNRYMELTNSELPSIVMEWEKLQDQIEEVKNSQEKYTASVEKWYNLKDAIEDVNNELELNKIKQEQAVGKDKIELMNKEIALYNKQIELNKQLQKEMEKEKEELKKFIKESGGIFQGDNLINYDDLFGKEVVGSEAVEALKKLEEAVKSYTDLCNSEIPSIVEKWESLNQEIEKVKQQQVDMAIDFEKDLYDVLAYYAKKENDLRKKDIENEKKAVEEKKKLLEERKKLLQETFDKEDREDALAEAQQTLAELDAQIQEALRSGDRELVKRLREQYAEAQKSLNEQIRDQERENALDQFDDIAESYDKEIEDLDDLIEELDKKLEEYLDPMNISKVIASAMNSGFVDIMGQTVEVNKVMSDFLKETTTGVYTTKEALKELEEQLKNIGAVASQLPGISDSLGLPDYSSSLNSRSAEIKTSQLVLNSPLVNIESLDNNSIAEFNEIMNDKINWLIGQINDKFNY